AEPSNIALLVLAVFLYGTLVLAERRSGHVIMLLVGLFAAGMPVIHMRGAHYGEIGKSTGGFFFVWTLWALGALGGFTFILSARGLLSLRRGQARESNNSAHGKARRTAKVIGANRVLSATPCSYQQAHDRRCPHRGWISNGSASR